VDLQHQLLQWIASQPRTYGETMDAWRSTCPRLTIWEDALREGFIEIEHDGTMANARVRLSARGRDALAESRVSPGSMPL
jgi:hypothetical protein